MVRLCHTDSVSFVCSHHVFSLSAAYFFIFFTVCYNVFMYKGLIECTHIINIFFAVCVLFSFASILFLFIFGCAGFSFVHVGFLWSPIEGAPLSLQFMGFSVQWLLFWPIGSRVQAQQLWCMGLIAPWHVESSKPRDQTHVFCIGRLILNHWTTRKVHVVCVLLCFS